MTKNRKPRTWGVHNHHDEEGIPTFFADVVGFTEAITSNVKEVARRQKKAVRNARLAGYRVITCQSQRDLVMAFRRRHYKLRGQEYILVHGGRAEVSPHRGEWAVTLQERVGVLRRPTGDMVTFVWGHRVNAAFPPFIRGEKIWRARNWQEHDTVSNRMIEKYLAKGHRVRAGGDPNTPKSKIAGQWVDAYEALEHEVGRGHFDRLASSDEIVDFDVLSKKKSDHHRMRATA